MAPFTCVSGDVARMGLFAVYAHIRYTFGESIIVR